MIGDRPAEPSNPAADACPPRGSLVIFLIVALALILAIGFFYVTKGQGDRDGEDAALLADTSDNAVHVVGNAAREAADRLRKRN